MATWCRQIWQVGRSWVEAIGEFGYYMRDWWLLNPEYRYDFLDDREAAQFVQEHATSNESMAYDSLLVGAQRTDLLRMLLLKYRGGVYADLDAKLLAPLRTIVPPRASSVNGRFWSSEMLAYEPMHPFLLRAAEMITAGVLRQVLLHREGDPARCNAPATCVIYVTGPVIYRGAVDAELAANGCGYRGSRHFRHCRASEAIRRTHVCRSDNGTVYLPWICGVVRHFDCRNNNRGCAGPACHMKMYSSGYQSAKHRACLPGHYMYAQNFFNLSVLRDGRATAARPLRRCQNEYSSHAECKAERKELAARAGTQAMLP
ncbi:hypothetical protein EMIHUDRAFT_241026 [Emiliania huxleyi CCMP1516]|uniref:Uncharacterized protein n=2 Tax=Emiliania huxleyi TaxID=2903 RepID=A0A0D3JDI9_EMIH1|nr:hypothetical protein EMIHUDRAFT_241026 [Emiliania huxleyi CCMP1516]EOD21574.1 hypothetical protein EMIHUDRAFT_241026 [Emiliania huxleyi CCMP1516]|eukprot:XP_005774003.1 hypothetical protein EMIHUDRAFT_241026 [Emiliania huxleyi CCMP1516]